MKEQVSNRVKTARVQAHRNSGLFTGEGEPRRRKQRRAWQRKQWGDRQVYHFVTTGAFWLTDNRWGYRYNLSPGEIDTEA